MPPREDKLSVIIPCYNCQDTLEEALASVYRQELTISFEVVMVDDASTDGTKKLITKLADRYDHVRCFFHDSNQGGGATRNTAVKKSEGNIVFCLDSDDILGDGTLKKMADMIRQKKCDGIGLHTSIKFNGKDKTNVSYTNRFGYIDEKIPFDSLFHQESRPLCPLYSVFMFTRKAWEIAGGYPTAHGFDTQGFAWRFLANGLTAYTCPGTVYYHRVNFHQSYYLREYEAGKVNHNWFKVFEEFLFLFNEETRVKLLDYNLNDPSVSITGIVNEPETVLRSDYRELLVPHSSEHYAGLVRTGQAVSPTDYYWLGARSLTDGSLAESLSALTYAKNLGLKSDHLYQKLFSVGYSFNAEEKKATDAAVKRLSAYQKLGSAQRWPKRILNKLKKVVKNTSVISGPALWFYCLLSRFRAFFGERRKKSFYYKQIADIKRKKRIVVELEFGGIGDCLVYSTLPRLLKEKYGIDFFLSERSLPVIRQPDTFKLCFEFNPYFCGLANDRETFRLKSFESEKKILTFLFDRDGENAIERLERQFSLDKGRGVPEIYYKPKLLEGYKNVILMDQNYISGKKFGWKFKPGAFEREAKKHLVKIGRVEQIDPHKQDIFTFVDMIYSCRYYIGTSSGGTAIAACFDKPFSQILPWNARNGSIYQFTFKNSRGHYTA